LEEIQDLLIGDVSISLRMKYSIKEKGQDDIKRLASLLTFSEPDSATMQLLAKRRHEWTEDPSRFWERATALHLQYLSPPAQIIGCYLQNQDDDP
jgi:hypothetical protein